MLWADLQNKMENLNQKDLILPLKIGARGSPLSIAQTKWLRANLAQAIGVKDSEIEEKLPIIPITTQGDKIQDKALLEAGGKGLFTRELDDALLDGRVDCAIHSMKDVPTFLPKGIKLLGSPEREDRRDALITKDGRKFEDLPQGATLGTASLRRSSQLKAIRPDLEIGLLRGNVGTRLGKIENGSFDATILAIAGLKRLGKSEVPHTLLDPIKIPPAIGQGALAITARADDKATIAAFKQIESLETTLEVAAERAFLAKLDGSCRTPIGAYCYFEGDNMLFIGEYFKTDGKSIRKTFSIPSPDMEKAERLGYDTAVTILAEL